MDYIPLSRGLKKPAMLNGLILQAYSDEKQTD